MGSDAKGTCTLTAAVPTIPSLVAVMLAVPAVIPVTRPAPDTVATLALLLAQVMARPVRPLPEGSCTVAVSCTVPPTGSVSIGGVTVTEATGATATLFPPQLIRVNAKKAETAPSNASGNQSMQPPAVLWPAANRVRATTNAKRTRRRPSVHTAGRRNAFYAARPARLARIGHPRRSVNRRLRLGLERTLHAAARRDLPSNALWQAARAGPAPRAPRVEARGRHPSRGPRSGRSIRVPGRGRRVPRRAPRAACKREQACRNRRIDGIIPGSKRPARTRLTPSRPAPRGRTRSRFRTNHRSHILSRHATPDKRR